jgi:hypothetical protein
LEIRHRRLVDSASYRQDIGGMGDGVSYTRRRGELS